MSLDLNALLKKAPVAATATTATAETETTHQLQVKTDSAPTKPKLAFQLGGKTVTAAVPAPAVNQLVLKPATTKRYWFHPESDSWTITEHEVSQEELESLATHCDEFTEFEYNAALAKGAPPESVELTIRPAEPEITEVKDFRATLDELDSLFVEGTGYTALTVDVARKRIVTAMQELKSNPELVQLVKDTDLRNIMAFINHSADSARATLSEKREKKETKAKTTARRRSLDMSGFAAAISDGAAGKSQGIAPDLNALATMDLSKMKLPGK